VLTATTTTDDTDSSSTVARSHLLRIPPSTSCLKRGTSSHFRAGRFGSSTRGHSSTNRKNFVFRCRCHAKRDAGTIAHSARPITAPTRWSPRNVQDAMVSAASLVRRVTHKMTSNADAVKRRPKEQMRPPTSSKTSASLHAILSSPRMPTSNTCCCCCCCPNRTHVGTATCSRAGELILTRGGCQAIGRM